MNNFESLFAALKRIALSEREKNAMRVHVRAFMQEHPVRVTLYQRVRNYFHVPESSRFIVRPVFATMAVFMTIGLSTAAAAEGALPGDALYAMKTGFNEKLQGTLALTPAAKAEWSASISSRRLEEAEVLAASGRLDPVALASVESGFDAAVQEFDANLTVLAQAHGEEGVATAQSNLEASLKAHEDVFNSLSLNSDSAKESLQSLASIVRAKSLSNSRTRNNSDNAQANTAGASTKVAARDTAQEADVEVASMTMMAMSEPADASSDAPIKPPAPDPTNSGSALMMASDTSVQEDARTVAKSTTSANVQIKKSDSESKNQRWGSAFNAFDTAVRAVKETRANIEARKKLKTTLGIKIGATTTTESKSTDSSNKGSAKSESKSEDVRDPVKLDDSLKDSGNDSNSDTNDAPDDSDAEKADDSGSDSSDSGKVKVETKNILNISTDLLR